MDSSQFTDFKSLYQKHLFKDEPTFFYPLWHYTNTKGLMGIVKNQLENKQKLYFWFTRSDCLNDPSEGTHVLPLFRQVCDELMQEKLISHDFYKYIYNIDIPDTQFINFPIPSKEENVSRSILTCIPCHAYICSFSLEEDSLDMWRYYSKNDYGYGLKCSPYLFEELKEYESSDYREDAVFCNMQSFKVIYQNDEKRNIIRDVILDSYKAYFNTPKGTDQDNALLGFIRSALKKYQFQFKHKCYATEKEYRFVYYLPDKPPAKLKNKMPAVLFRNSNGMIIPYLEVEITDGKRHLEEVMISPYTKNEKSFTTTKNYLSHCGFDCPIKVSTLPVRE